MAGAVAEAQLTVRDHLVFPRSQDHHRAQDIGHGTTVGAGVIDHCPAYRAGDPHSPLQAPQPDFSGAIGQTRERDSAVDPGVSLERVRLITGVMALGKGVLVGPASPPPDHRSPRLLPTGYSQLREKT